MFVNNMPKGLYLGDRFVVLFLVNGAQVEYCPEINTSCYCTSTWSDIKIPRVTVEVRGVT